VTAIKSNQKSTATHYSSIQVLTILSKKHIDLVSKRFQEKTGRKLKNDCGRKGALVRSRLEKLRK
jgi:hypothetical protein